MNKSSCCFTSLPVFGVISVPNFRRFNGCVVLSNCCFNLHFPDDKWCISSFTVFISHLYIFSGEVSVKVFGPAVDRMFAYPQNSYVEILPSNVLALGGGGLWIWLGHEGSAFMNGISAIIKKTRRAPSPFPPCEVPVRRWLSTNQESGPSQNLTIVASWSWTSSRQNCEK